MTGKQADKWTDKNAGKKGRALEDMMSERQEDFRDTERQENREIKKKQEDRAL